MQVFEYQPFNNFMPCISEWKLDGKGEKGICTFFLILGLK